MSDYKTQLKNGAVEGLKKGWSSFVWMSKIAIPVSLVITLLQWTGWISSIYFLLDPLTRFMHLPPEAALPILSGVFGNLYALLAVLSVMPFTVAQMTLIGIFGLVAHNMILEGIVQHKSGINVVKIVTVRLVTAVLFVFLASHFFQDTSRSVTVPASLSLATPFLVVMKNWLLATLTLLLKIFGIIMGIMVFLSCVRALGWTDRLIGLFRPLLRVLGLPERTAMMFIAAVFFGVFYAGAVIVEETKKGDLTKEELENFHVFVAINHAVIEDPALFAVFGVNYLWLFLPRILAAVVAVQAYRLANLAAAAMMRLAGRRQTA